MKRPSAPAVASTPAAKPSAPKASASKSSSKASAASGGVDPALVREIAQALVDTNLTEIEVRRGDLRIRVSRQTLATPAAYAPAPLAAAPAPPMGLPSALATPASASLDDHPGAVKSPMVGTVYLAAEPSAPAFVSPGDKIAAGQTLLIVEAMKVMNPITAPRAGTVRQVLVENGQPVEFDQPLVIVE